MTAEEREAVTIVTLRLAGVHPTWIEWAQHHRDAGMLEWMGDLTQALSTLSENVQGSLLASWQRPLPTGAMGEARKRVTTDIATVDMKYSRCQRDAE